MPYVRAFFLKRGRICFLFINGMGNQTAYLTFPIMDGEENLVRSAVGGDSSAFGSLYDRYQPMIYRFIAVKVGRREDAEDITHQVFMSAWQSIAGYRDLGHPFSSWLYRIARNQVIDYYRARKQDVSLETLDVESIAGAAVSQIDLSAKLDLEKTIGAVHRLKPDYQDVILMRFVEDLSIEETARAMKRSQGAVKLLQHRAIKELQRLLEGKK